MKIIFSAGLVMSAMTLAGCGGGSGGSSSTNSTTIDTTSNNIVYPGQNPDGTYTVVIHRDDNNGYRTEDADTVSTKGASSFNDRIKIAGSGNDRIAAVENEDYTALSGYVDGLIAFDDGQYFADLNGTQARPTTQMGEYATFVYVATADGNSASGGSITLSADFTNNTIVTSSADPLVDIKGDIAAGGAAITGTATYNGSTASMVGGFYDEGKDVAGAFANDQFHGVYEGN